jgi:hypothetical protein
MQIGLAPGGRLGLAPRQLSARYSTEHFGMQVESVKIVSLPNFA